MVSNLSSPEYAIWNIFLAINSFVMLFDLGYGVVIQRFVMYANSGVDHFENGSIPKLSSFKQPNYKLLYQLMVASSNIYINITRISSIILLLMTPYIIFISNDYYNVLQIIIPWIVFSLSVAINMYILTDSTIIKGLGLVGDLQKITLINSLISTVTKILTLQMGLGIIGLTLSFLGTSILLAWQYKRITNKVKNINIPLYAAAKKSFYPDFIESYNIIKTKSKGIGGVLISNFLQNQLFIIMAPLFLSLDIMGRYGVTWQIINIIASLSSITFSTYSMKMGNYLVSNNITKLKEIFSLTISLFLTLYTLGSFIVIFLGEYILQHVGSQTELLELHQVILIIFYVLIIQINQKSTLIISLNNDQQYVKSLIISSVIIGVTNIIVLYLGYGITVVLTSSIIIQSVYNLWKWGIESMKLCDVNFRDFIIQPLIKIRFYLNFFNNGRR